MNRLGAFWNKWGTLIAFVAIVGVAAFGLIKLGIQQDTIDAQQVQLQHLVQALAAQQHETELQRIASCKASREALQPYFADQLHESLKHGVHYYSTRFPGFTAAELVHLVEHQRDQLRDVVHALEPHGCGKPPT